MMPLCTQDTMMTRVGVLVTTTSAVRDRALGVVVLVEV
jgi:hypothetical protein